MRTCPVAGRPRGVEGSARATHPMTCVLDEAPVGQLRYHKLHAKASRCCTEHLARLGVTRRWSRHSTTLDKLRFVVTSQAMVYLPHKESLCSWRETAQSSSSCGSTTLGSLHCTPRRRRNILVALFSGACLANLRFRCLTPRPCSHGRHIFCARPQWHCQGRHG